MCFILQFQVGIDYIGAALDFATEKAASFKTVQVSHLLFLLIVFDTFCSLYSVNLYPINLLSAQAALAVGDWILGTAEGFAPGEVRFLIGFSVSMSIFHIFTCLSSGLGCAVKRA